jgi:hypothetical protein
MTDQKKGSDRIRPTDTDDGQADTRPRQDVELPASEMEQSPTDMEQGDRTRPAQPGGTKPLERDYWPQNQKR